MPMQREKPFRQNRAFLHFFRSIATFPKFPGQATHAIYTEMSKGFTWNSQNY